MSSADRGMKVTATARPGSAFALCIGNSRYAASPLQNAANDAEDVAKLCRALGFDTQLLAEAGLDAMLDAVDAFAHKLQRGGVALFFFAGHGIEERGSNFLIPIDYKEEDSQRLDYKALKVSSVLSKMDGVGCHLNLVVLDACRSKPLPVRGGSRALGRGLAKMEAPAGTLVAFACAPGHTASDGSGRNGVFTESLLRHLGSPGLDIDFVMRAVVNDVEKASNGQQVPFRDSSLKVTPCCLIEAPPAPAAAPAEAPPSPAAAPIAVEAELAAFLESCRFDASQRSEVAAALRDIGVRNGSHLDLCHEEDLQGLRLPPVTLRVLRAGLKTRRDAAAKARDEAATRKADAERKAADAVADEVSQKAKNDAAAAAARLAAEEATAKQAKEQALAAAAAAKAAASEVDAQRAAEAQAAAKAAVDAAVEAAMAARRSVGTAATAPLTAQAQVYAKQMEGKTELNLGYNSIGDAGAAALAEALKANKMLTNLYLYGNSIGDAGAAALAEALKANTMLTALYLDSNSIGDAGAAALAEALKANKTLTALYLSSNSIGDAGAAALAEALKANTMLTALYLYGTSIGDAGAAALRLGARSGCTVYGLPHASCGGCCVVS